MIGNQGKVDFFLSQSVDVLHVTIDIPFNDKSVFDISKSIDLSLRELRAIQLQKNKQTIFLPGNDKKRAECQAQQQGLAG